MIEIAHRTAESRREGFVNAQIMVACGWVASAILAGYLAILNVMSPDDPLFDRLAGTWRIVAASLLAFAVSETVDNSFGAYLRDRITTPGASSRRTRSACRSTRVVFLFVAFGSLGFIGRSSSSTRRRCCTSR